jgi:hypothetical protein
MGRNESSRAVTREPDFRMDSFIVFAARDGNMIQSIADHLKVSEEAFAQTGAFNAFLGKDTSLWTELASRSSL